MQHYQREVIKDHTAATIVQVAPSGCGTTAQEVEKDEDEYDDDHWKDRIVRIMGNKENSVNPLRGHAVLDSESEEEESSVCLPGMPLVEFEDELEYNQTMQFNAI